MASGGEIYSLAENMTDAEYEKKLSSLNEKQKKKYEILVRLGDSPKLALATTLLSNEVKWSDDTTRAYTMAEGGELHRSSEKYAEGGETKKFSEREFKDILDEALEHFYMGLNKIDSAMRYLEVRGQAGLKNPFAAKIGLSNLKESIEKIDEYTSKK